MKLLCLQDYRAQHSERRYGQLKPLLHQMNSWIPKQSARTVLWRRHAFLVSNSLFFPTQSVVKAAKGGFDRLRNHPDNASVGILTTWLQNLSTDYRDSGNCSINPSLPKVSHDHRGETSGPNLNWTLKELKPDGVQWDLHILFRGWGAAQQLKSKKRTERRDRHLTQRVPSFGVLFPTAALCLWVWL